MFVRHPITMIVLGRTTRRHLRDRGAPATKMGGRVEPTTTQTVIALAPVEVRLDDTGRRRLFLTTAVRVRDTIMPLGGRVRSSPSRYSIQLSAREHLDDLGAIEATNHSCDPSARVDFSDPARPALRATRDLRPGSEVTIDYCATEADMTVPFTCDCGAHGCYGVVRGFTHLDARRREALLPFASPFIRSLEDR